MRLKHLIFLGVIAAAAAIAAYVSNFGPASGWRPSSSTEDWSRFGAYLGGVFGILAFVGVLITLELQRQQLALQRRQIKQLTEQATVDELHRLCRDIASNIDQLLNLKVIVGQRIGDQLNALNIDSSVRGVLELAARDSAIATQIGAPMKRHADLLEPELDLLANCINDAEIHGGSIIILGYYRIRYGEIVRRLKLAGRPIKSEAFWTKEDDRIVAVRP